MRAFVIPCEASWGRAADQGRPQPAFRFRAPDNRRRRENGRQHSVEAEMHRVTAADLTEAREIGQERIDKVAADASLGLFVEFSRGFDVLGCLSKDDDRLQRRRRSFSSASVRNCASPESSLAFRSASTWPCHSGESTGSFSRNDAHNHSIACRRSALLSRGISSRNSRTLTGSHGSSNRRGAQTCGTSLLAADCTER